ncbi:GrpE, mitochondrial [Malassezia sp. CBS 17886]|nr:GrpE, mitochondrial [Malassezia sp. CBS 17886]
MSMSVRGSLFGRLARPLTAPRALSAAPRALVSVPRGAAATRMYSEKAEGAAAEDAQTNAEAKGDDAAPSVEDQLKERDERIRQLSDQVLYGKAELQNLQRRSSEEKANAAQTGAARLAKDLTESIDILDLALKSVPEKLRSHASPSDAHRALVDLYNGLNLTRKSVLDMLRSHGVEPFNPEGEPFDPKLHEALYQAPIPDKTPGSVLECSKIGYTINGRLLRAAQVGVVQAE